MSRPRDGVGDAELAVLSRMLLDTRPRCDGDPRFTADTISAAEAARLDASHCRHCPLAAACDAYGSAARPVVGLWAGRTYPKGTPA